VKKTRDKKGAKDNEIRYVALMLITNTNITGGKNVWTKEKKKHFRGAEATCRGCVGVCNSVWQRVAVCCSVLQCVAAQNTLVRNVKCAYTRKHTRTQRMYTRNHTRTQHLLYAVVCLFCVKTQTNRSVLREACNHH